MINTSSEIKSIYENAKEALKSIENVSIIVLIGILLRCIYPNKFASVLKMIEGEVLSLIISIFDLLFVSSLFLTCITMILVIIFWVLWKGNDIYSETTKKYDEKMRERLELFHRFTLGCDIRFISLSQWVVIFYGILFILDTNKFQEYTRPLENIINRLNNFNLFDIILIVSFIIIICRVLFRLLERIFYKYLYLHPVNIKGKNYSNNE